MEAIKIDDEIIEINEETFAEVRSLIKKKEDLLLIFGIEE